MSIDKSIQEEGLKNPIIVKRLKGGWFELVDGLTRLGCVKGDTIQCIIMGETGYMK